MVLEDSNSLDPETLSLLTTVYDRCMCKIEGVYGGDLTVPARRQLVAGRLMGLAQQGVTDPDQLATRALAGLLPEYPR
jgi:hypothetical protein